MKIIHPIPAQRKEPQNVSGNFMKTAIKYKRTNLQDKYYVLEIFECPTEVIMFAASLGAKNVTIENYMHYHKSTSASLNISCDKQTLTPILKRYDVDFEISKYDFNSLESIWHSNGCYAVFHDESDLKFKATNLKDIARYKALDNYNWTLELAIPSSSSDGWGSIVSPSNDIIDKIEKYIKNYR